MEGETEPSKDVKSVVNQDAKVEGETDLSKDVKSVVNQDGKVEGENEASKDVESAVNNVEKQEGEKGPSNDVQEVKKPSKDDESAAIQSEKMEEEKEPSKDVGETLKEVGKDPSKDAGEREPAGDVEKVPSKDDEPAPIRNEKTVVFHDEEGEKVPPKKVDKEPLKEVEAAVIPSAVEKETLTDVEAANLSRDVEAGDAFTGIPLKEDIHASTLSRHDDPFATREGKTLLWKNVNMTLGGEREVKLLDDVWGEVPRKETTAIMGPSGAGKTSLLNILAGRARSRGKVTIKSDVRLNNYQVDPTNITVRKLIAFVAQDDSLQVTATPREAIYFSAKLRLPRSTTESQLKKLTERMIAELGLTKCADTMVGGELIKGISGGERKRTSIGVELVVKPAMVFLDEPTSGLDSFSAVQLCQVLKKVANAGASVLFTIHQPSSEIFSSFDHLILLNKGRVMYQGPVAGVPKYFADRGHPNPQNYNPADWIMNVAQSVPLDELQKLGFFQADERDIGEPFEPEEGKDALGITITRRSTADLAVLDERPPGFAEQTSLLFLREGRNLSRDTAALGARFGITIFMGVLVGIIFLNVGASNSANPQNLNSHFGALVMVLLLAMFGTAQPALLAFPEERPVFLREYSTNHYSVVAYFMSRLAMEATITCAQMLVSTILSYFMIKFQMGYGIFFATVYTLAMASTAIAVLLGSALETPKAAQEMLPLLFVPQMLFAGFFVTPDLIPVWLRWARWLCTLTYAINIVMVAEFENCNPKNPAANTSCNNLLKALGASSSNDWWSWIVLIVLFVFFRTIALFVLRAKATKFY